MGAWFVVCCMTALLVMVLAVGFVIGRERREKVVMFANKLGE